jgi:hypothetical protein
MTACGDCAIIGNSCAFLAICFATALGNLFIGAGRKRNELKAKTKFRAGVVADATLSCAEESGVDLLILSAQGHGKHEGSALGIATYKNCVVHMWLFC